MKKVLADPSLGISKKDAFVAPGIYPEGLNCNGADDDMLTGSTESDPFFN